MQLLQSPQPPSMGRFLGRSCPAIAGFLLLFLANTAGAQVLIDFQTAGQFANNFRKVTSNSDSAAQTANAFPANNYLRYDRTTTTSNVLAYMYDTTPGDTTVATQSVFSTATALTVSYGLRATSATSSFGIYFADPNDINNNLLVLFNLDSSGSTDQFRFFRDGAMSSAGVGTQVGLSQSGSTGFNAGTITPATTPFAPLSATLTVAGTTPTLSLTVGSQTFSQTFSAGDFNFSGGNTTVIVRMFDPNPATNTPMDIDDFQIVSVPEPSSGILLLSAAGLWAVVRRKKHRL